jgi:hypothetical protein
MATSRCCEGIVRSFLCRRRARVAVRLGGNSTLAFGSGLAMVDILGLCKEMTSLYTQLFGCRRSAKDLQQNAKGST